MSEETTRSTPVEISLSAVLNDLENGVTRKTGDKGYDESRGSVQEKYGLSKSDVTELFKHPALAGKKVKIPKVVSFIIKDDRPDPTYGTPSAAGEKRMADARIQADAEAEAEQNGSVEGAIPTSIPETDSVEATTESGSDEIVKTENPEEVQF